MPPSLDGDGLHQTAAHKIQWSCGFSIRLPLMSIPVEPGGDSCKSSTAATLFYLIPWTTLLLLMTTARQGQFVSWLRYISTIWCQWCESSLRHMSEASRVFCSSSCRCGYWRSSSLYGWMFNICSRYFCTPLCRIFCSFISMMSGRLRILAKSSLMAFIGTLKMSATSRELTGRCCSCNQCATRKYRGKGLYLMLAMFHQRD